MLHSDGGLTAAVRLEMPAWRVSTRRAVDLVGHPDWNRDERAASCPCRLAEASRQGLIDRREAPTKVAEP